MRYRAWRGICAATLGFLVVGTNAQTGSSNGLEALLEKQENLTSFYSYIKKYPEVLLELPSQGVTILAPDNKAFDKLPFTALNKAFDRNDTDAIINALSYHILRETRKAANLVPGVPYNIPTLMTSSNYTNVTGGQRVTSIKQSGDAVVFVSGLGSRCTLTEADLEYNGGVVQVIDSFLIPPANLTTTMASFNLTSFEGALFTSEKMEEVSLAKDITIFAPNNDAFLALGPAISNMTIEQLSSVLDYHIVPKLVYSADIKNGTNFTTQSGKTITVLQIDNSIFLNSAELITKDILVANGVIHTLDNVLNPEDAGPVPDPANPTQPAVFSSASSVTNIPFTTAIPCTESCPVSRGGATNEGIGPTGTARTTGLRSSSSSALAAAMARETAIGAAGLMAVLGGAVMMI